MIKLSNYLMNLDLKELTKEGNYIITKRISIS